MDSERWWWLLSKNQRILNLREFFHNEKYRVFTQHAAVAVMRHSATMGSHADVDAYLVWPVLLKRDRTVAKCDLWIHWATQCFYHGWSVWRPVNSLGFTKNISEWKQTDDSTDALIPYVRVANIAVTRVKILSCLGHVCYTSWEGMIETFTIDSCCLRTTFIGQHSEIKILVVLIDFMVPADWRTTHWDGPPHRPSPNRQPLVVRWATQDLAFSTALLFRVGARYLYLYLYLYLGTDFAVLVPVPVPASREQEVPCTCTCTCR